MIKLLSLLLLGLIIISCSKEIGSTNIKNKTNKIKKITPQELEDKKRGVRRVIFQAKIGKNKSEVLISLKTGKKVEESKWYKNHKLKSKESFKNGILEGKSIWWRNDGSKYEEISYKNGVKDGIFIRYHLNGKKLSEQLYKNGKENGKLIRWEEDGRKSTESTYKDGIKDGIFTAWFKNGKKSETFYKNGKPNGKYTLWYKNGKKEREYFYKDGLADGVSINWNKDGKKLNEELYKNGKKVK